MFPRFLQQELDSPPEAGTGLHPWLFRIARHLHHHMPPEEAIELLEMATARLELSARRRFELKREIRQAVMNSIGAAWRPKDEGIRGGDSYKKGSSKTSAGPNPKSDNVPAPEIPDQWPKPDLVARYCRIQESRAAGICGLADLFESSPVKPSMSADDWIDWLFPGAEWLCLAKDTAAEARSRRREKWYFVADDHDLIVPSPMTGPSGRNQSGRLTDRCLDNTGPRRWLVIEFDPKKWKSLSEGEKKGWRDEAHYNECKLDEQAALHWHFMKAASVTGWPPLALCVHSGGKSLHGWYGPVTNEEDALELMSYAATLDADPSTWNRCQMVRLPGGRRKLDKPTEGDLWTESETHARLEVFFFDPEQKLLTRTDRNVKTEAA